MDLDKTKLDSTCASNSNAWRGKSARIREETKVGRFIRKSLQVLNHEDVLLALEARVQNTSGLRSGLAMACAILKTSRLELGMRILHG